MASMENVLVDYENRMFLLSDGIDNVSVGKMCFEILQIIAEDDREGLSYQQREPITIYINSEGGNLYDMWGLIDVMVNSTTPIKTICLGYAFSSAFKIFLAGHKRYAMKHSTFMYHQLSSELSDKIYGIKRELDELEYKQRNINDFIIERTKISEILLKEINRTSTDWYICSPEAETLGIIDGIINKGNNKNVEENKDVRKQRRTKKRSIKN